MPRKDRHRTCRRPGINDGIDYAISRFDSTIEATWGGRSAHCEDRGYRHVKFLRVATWPAPSALSGGNGENFIAFDHSIVDMDGCAGPRRLFLEVAGVGEWVIIVFSLCIMLVVRNWVVGIIVAAY